MLSMQYVYCIFYVCMYIDNNRKSVGITYFYFKTISITSLSLSNIFTFEDIFITGIIIN